MGDQILVSHYPGKRHNYETTDCLILEMAISALPFALCRTHSFAWNIKLPCGYNVWLQIQRLMVNEINSDKRTYSRIGQ